MKKLMMTGAIAAAVMAVAPDLQAQTVSLTRSTLQTEFFPGSGNSNTNFAITRRTVPGQYIELGIKAKQRYAGDANVGGTGNTYVVQRGYSQNEPPDAPVGAWWNFDFSIDMRGGSRSFTDTIVFLEISFNGVPVFFANSDTLGATGQLAQGSENIAFFGMDPTALGTYDFVLRAQDRNTFQPLAGVTMQTVVIPLPSAAGMALAGIGLLGMRRRR